VEVDARRVRAAAGRCAAMLPVCNTVAIADSEREIVRRVISYENTGHQNYYTALKENSNINVL